jgi:hypothetical protein
VICTTGDRIHHSRVVVDSLERSFGLRFVSFL